MVLAILAVVAEAPREQQQQQQQQPTEPITNAISGRTFIALTAPSPPIDDFSAIRLQHR